MELYAENILEHYRHPRHRGLLADADVRHEEINHSCGDKVTLSLRLHDGCITGVGWEGEGCAVSQAGMSLLSEELMGKRVPAAASMTQKDMLDLLGVPVGPRRFKCALLGMHTLKNALRAADGLPPQSWVETVSTED